MSSTTARLAGAAALAVAAAAGTAEAAQKIVDSFAGPTIQYSGSPSLQNVTFNTAEAITGIGIEGNFTAISGDLGGGSYPWSLDLTVDVTAPGGESFTWGPNITGDFTIADFPVLDASGPGLSGNAGPGNYQFALSDDFGGFNSLAAIENPTYYATTTVPDVTFDYTANPDPNTSWDRPFFIGGVSGLGPTSYDAFEFVVTEPGRYDFSSVLSNGDDHFTFLYRGAFDPDAPLDNLVDYGLGNGNSPFGVPRGTSAFSALLFPGETYFWVTSQWSAFDDIVPSANNITGPGSIIPAPATALLAPLGIAAVARRKR